MSETPRQLLARLWKRAAFSVEDYKRLDAALVRLDVLEDADRRAVRGLGDSVTALLQLRADVARVLAAAPGGQAGAEIVTISTGLSATAEGPGPMTGASVVARHRSATAGG